MAEFGGNEQPKVDEALEGGAHERHERVVSEAIDRLRAEGYFHEGESAELVMPEPGSAAAWKVCCKVTALESVALAALPVDPDRKTKFPAADPLKEAFLAAGYRVSICPGDESEDPNLCMAEYYLYEAGV